MLHLSSFVKAFLISIIIMPATLQCKEMQALETVSDGSNKFAMDLYQAVCNTSRNIVISPISAQIVLALAYTGAKKSTADEMAKALHLPKQKEHVLQGYKALITGLEDPALNMANRIYIENHFEIKEQFVTTACCNFLSSVEKEDFANHPAESREEINNWVAEQTNQKIKDLLPSGVVTNETRLVLVNAIHFKAKWLHAFDPRYTTEAPFYITPTETVNVPMMVLNSKSFKYANSEVLDAQILELPYEGNEFSMIIILPNTVDGLGCVESKLACINLSDELSKLNNVSVNLQLPRFTIEQTTELNEPLQQLGMSRAFSDNADFSGMTDEKVKISTVIQKAFIEVNEEGTEAAAATGVVVKLRLRVIEEEVNVDHPFLFLILSKPNTVLFIGALIEAPNQEMS